MKITKEIDTEINNSPALKFLFEEILAAKQQLKNGFCPKCGTALGYDKGHNIYACTGNCGFWKDIKQ